MRTAILITWPKGAKTPELEFFEKDMRAAHDAFKATIPKKVRAELWESGTGIVRRHNGGSGKINLDGGKTFAEGLADRRREAEAEAKTAEEIRAKRMTERDRAAGITPIPENSDKGKTKEATKAKGKTKEATKAKTEEAGNLSSEELNEIE